MNARPAVLSLLALAVATSSAAQATPDQLSRVDEIFARYDTESSPGCAVGVTRFGEPVLERAYGMANLEWGVPNEPDAIMETGSVAKQFTSAAIMLLVLDAELSLDDDVRDYVPELPDYGSTITIHHLMTHTSGLRDWGSVAAISGWGRGDRSHNHAHMLDILSRQTELNFTPGDQYSYSNSGYNLMAVIVDRVSGESFADFSRNRLFEPLGMTDTHWRDDYRRIVPGRATAYRPVRDGGWEIDQPIEYVHGNGGLLTTVRDLGIWNQRLTDGRGLGGDAFLELMHRPGVLNDGTLTQYAGGLMVGESLGVRSVSHGGATAGYRTYLSRYPEQGLSVALLCNAANAGTGGLASRVAREFLGDVVRDPPEIPHGDIARDDSDRFTGLYRHVSTGTPKMLTVVGDVLRDGNATLDPAGDLSFSVGQSDRRYVFEPDLQSFRIDSWEYTDGEVYERVDEWRPSLTELREFEGTYVSEDADATFVVTAEPGALSLWMRPDIDRTLTPIYRDGFRSGAPVFRFRRDGSGNVTALSFSFGRVFDMRFERVED